MAIKPRFLASMGYHIRESRTSRHIKVWGEDGVLCAAFRLKKSNNKREAKLSTVPLFAKMTSFRKTRDELLLSFCEGIVNEDEFLLLYDVNKSKNPEYPYWNHERFRLQDKDEVECKTEFRFEKYDIPLLADILDLPEVTKCKQGTICDNIEGLCIVLKRLCFPQISLRISSRDTPFISPLVKHLLKFRNRLQKRSKPLPVGLEDRINHLIRGNQRQDVMHDSCMS